MKYMYIKIVGIINAIKIWLISKSWTFTIIIRNSNFRALSINLNLEIISPRVKLKLKKKKDDLTTEKKVNKENEIISKILSNRNKDKIRTIIVENNDTKRSIVNAEFLKFTILLNFSLKVIKIS